MKFLIKESLKLTLFLLFLTLLYEIVSDLIVYYYQLELTESTPTFQGFLVEAEGTLNVSIDYLRSLTLKEFKFVQLIIWVYLHHFYYLIILFVFLIFYYEYKLKTMPAPLIGQRPMVTPQAHAAQKKTFTEQQVAKLVQTPGYKALKEGVFQFHDKPQAEETIRVLQQKENEIFG